MRVLRYGKWPGPALSLLLLWATALCLPVSSAAAAGSLRLEQGSNPLTHGLMILEDPDRNLGPELAGSPAYAGRFKMLSKGSLNLGMTTSAIWLKFSIAGDENRGASPYTVPARWLLTLNQPTLMSAKLYGASSTGGRTAWRALRPYSRFLNPTQTPGRFIVFKLPQDLTGGNTFLLRLAARGGVVLVPRVEEQAYYLKQSIWQIVVLCTYCGAILALAVYNFLLYLSIRDRSYLWYVLVVMLMAVYFLGFSGMYQDLEGPLLRPLADNLPVYALGLAYFFRGTFARSFLMSRANAPLMDKLILVFAVVIGAAGFSIGLPGMGHWAAVVTTSLALVWPFAVMATGIQCLRVGFKPAKYFILASSLAVMSSLVFIVTLKGWVPLTNWNHLVQPTCYTLEAVLLSFALGYRINSLRKARAGAEEALKETEARHKWVMNSVPDPILVADLNGGVSYLNPSFSKVFGWEQSDLASKGLSGLPVDSREPLQGVIKDLAQGVEFRDHEITLQAKNGRRLHVNLSGALLKNHRAEAKGVVLAMQDISTIKLAEKKLRTRTRQLLRLARELSAVEEKQRRAIAEDLHDSVTQNLAAGVFRLKNLGQTTAGGPDGEELDAVCCMLDQALGDVRSLTIEISPPVLYDLGLAPALEWLADNMRERYGLNVAFSCHGHESRLDENLEITLYRCARELLINVVKHAGTDEAELNLEWEDNLVRVEISDKGKGFDPQSTGQVVGHGFGLFSIRERMELLGGKTAAHAAPGSGCRVALSAPVIRQDPPAREGAA